jgi:ribose/xylose/arabinose/galactoside ABC-type transport system permease subunit
MRTILRFRDYGIYAVLAVVVLYFTLTTRDHVFILGNNPVDILVQSSILCIAAVGMTLVIITGGIDLSMGSIMALVGLLSAIAGAQAEWPWYVILPMAAGIGVAAGSINAFCITILDIPPLITTLGSMAAWRGAVNWITQAKAVYNTSSSSNWDALTWMGKGTLLGIPAPIVVAGVMMTLGWIGLNKTIWGTYLYGIGCNEEACRLSGVNVRRMKFMAYGLSGTIFAIAGLVNMGRQGYALPLAATGFELDVITAVVLGGVSIMGGEGKLSGVIAGVLILGALDNGLTMLNVQFYEISVIKGSVLLLAVGFDRFCRRVMARQESAR